MTINNTIRNRTSRRRILNIINSQDSVEARLDSERNIQVFLRTETFIKSPLKSITLLTGYQLQNYNFFLKSLPYTPGAFYFTFTFPNLTESLLSALNVIPIFYGNSVTENYSDMYNYISFGYVWETSGSSYKLHVNACERFTVVNNFGTIQTVNSEQIFMDLKLYYLNNSFFTVL